MANIKHILIGFIIGIANLIPGVSGGTFALILGVYERLIRFLNTIGVVSLKTLAAKSFSCIKSGGRGSARAELLEFLITHDYPFMGKVLLGVFLSIITLSKVMTYLLTQHFEYTYAYFFGLIILSVIIPFRLIRKKGVAQVVALIVGIALTVFVAAQVNPADKVIKKSALIEQQYHESNATDVTADESAQRTGIIYSSKFSTGEFLYIFICGAIAISAMVLPGVSGSLVLILMGQYFTVVSAISAVASALLMQKSLLLDEVLLLSVMGIGIVVGLLGFSRFIEFALQRYHDTMIAFLVGLITGSLYPLWPFKEYIVIDHYVKSGGTIEIQQGFKAYSNSNILPNDGTTLLISLICLALGVVTMYFFVKKEVVSDNAGEHES